MDIRLRRKQAKEKLPKGLTRIRVCELLEVSRANLYRHLKDDNDPVESDVWSDTDERLAAKIDDIHLDSPAYGARKIAHVLQSQGESNITRYLVNRLMKMMGIKPCCPMPSLSAPAKDSKKFPYLLKGVDITRPNQVWSTDITYVQIGGKHMYLTAVIDWYSRYIVSWRLTDTMQAKEVVASAKDAFEAFGTPEIMNSDQGSVFGSEAYVELLKSKGIKQSMDGKARWRDNVLMERWFRTLKSECLRQTEYTTPAELRAIIDAFVEWYNERRIHQSLNYETPAKWYGSAILEAA